MFQQAQADGFSIPGTVIVPVARARPFFPGGDHAPENGIRGYYQECCCGARPGTGPNVPPHWFDGGHGWATAHFFDVQAVDLEQKQPGVHQCKYCTYIAEGEECCDKTSCCWCPLGKAPGKMADHLTTTHAIAPPRMRQWATECTDTQGCCDVLCCFPCQASRQMNAMNGFANRFNVFWCLIFSMGVLEHQNHNGEKVQHCTYCLAAYMTRDAIKTLNRIDESCCKTFMMSTFCSCCSIAQTYREYTAAGVWPGGMCNGDAPPAIMMNNPPPEHVQVMGAPFGQQGSFGKAGGDKLQ